MADSGEGLAVLYDTSLVGGGQLPISSTNANAISSGIDLKWATTASIQILTDGGAKVNWTYQVSNLPTLPGNWQGRSYLGATTRDDSLTSAMWSTVSTGSLAAGGSQQGTILTLATTVHRHGRLLFNWDSGNTGGSTAKVFAVVRTMGYG